MPVRKEADSHSFHSDDSGGIPAPPDDTVLSVWLIKIPFGPTLFGLRFFRSSIKSSKCAEMSDRDETIYRKAYRGIAMKP